MNYNPTDIARQFLFVREAEAANRGLRVEAIQHWSSGQYGDSWCAEFATMVLDLCFRGASPVPRLQACEDVHQLAIKNGWISDAPDVDDLYLYVTDQGHAHHIGIVTATSPLTGISGNTSADGVSSNGDRVAEHEIHATVFVKYPRG